VNCNPNDPVQLQLTFRNAEKKEKSKAFLEEVSGKVLVLPLSALPDAHPPEFGALADPGGIKNISGCHAP
jgi:hypothetical protein